MAYIPTIWNEILYTEAQILTNLNNLEKIYDEIGIYAATILHSTRYYSKTFLDDNYYHADNDGENSGFIVTSIDGYTYEQIIAGAVPRGSIIIWHDTEASIPAGYVLCDGMNGTHDMRNKYPICAGNTYEQGSSGGNNFVSIYASNVTIAGHLLTVDEIPSHHHHLYDYYRVSGAGVTGGTSGATGALTSTTSSTTLESSSPHTHTASFQGDDFDIRPASVALCYIMRELE